MNKIEELILTIQSVAKKLREIKAQELENSDFPDFSLSNFRYIEEIYNMGNPTFIELTNRLGLSKPTVTLMIAKLIEKGFVKKMRSGTDGRIYHLSLTGNGEKIIKDYNKIYQKFVDRAASKYDENELALLISLLKRML